MANNTWNQIFYKGGRNCKKNQEFLSDETALRDEILELKRQVMVLRKTNEQNLVKFRKYDEEAKRKDREIEQLMDPRKNADVTKILSTKGAAILMSLKDQNNALIQMVLNKDVQIKRLLAEMKMSKLYASSKRNVSYKEEIARLKNLLVKSQEKLKQYLEKENQAKLMCDIESSFPEFSSSSGQSSPRDLDELQLVIRNLEAHIKYSNDLLNKKNQEISILNDEVNFLKKLLLQHKTPKNKMFDRRSAELHNCSNNASHLLPGVSDGNPQMTKVPGAESLELFEKSPDTESKNQSNSAPNSSTRLSLTIDSLLKHKSLSNIISNENDDECIKAPNSEMKTEENLFHRTAAGEKSNVSNIVRKFDKTEKVKERKKVQTRHRESRKWVPRKFSRSAKKKKFYENEKKNRNVVMLKTILPKKKEGNSTAETVRIINTKETEVSTKLQEVFMDEESPEFDENNPETIKNVENLNERKSPNVTINSNLVDIHKAEDEADNTNGNISEIEINFPVQVEISEKRATKEENFRREIYQQSFDSSFESENGYSMKQQVQQVQVEVQIDSIIIQTADDKSENSHQKKFTETRVDHCDDNNDDDNDVIIR